MLPQLGSRQDKTTVWWEGAGAVSGFTCLFPSVSTHQFCMSPSGRDSRAGCTQNLSSVFPVQIIMLVGLWEAEKEDRCTVLCMGRIELGLASRWKKMSPSHAPFLGSQKTVSGDKDADSYNFVFHIYVKLCGIAFQSLWNRQTDRHQDYYLFHQLLNRFECTFLSACLPLSLRYGAAPKFRTFEMTVDREEG